MNDLKKQALVHRSYLNESRELQSNERLEFLGDSVISLFTSLELYRRYPKFSEGELTNLRSALVRTETLAQTAKTLQLGDQLLMSRGEENCGGRQNISLLADAFEAVVGALYLSDGPEATKEFLEKNLFGQIENLNRIVKSFDFKSQLQEQVQKNQRRSPIYKVVEQTGPDHEKTFVVEVLVDNISLGIGTGKSKQHAEQAAAKVALEKNHQNKL